MYKTVFEGNTSVKPNGAKLSVDADILSGNSAITMSTENGQENSIQRLYTNELLIRVISGDCTYDYTYNHKGQIVNVKVNGEDYATYYHSEYTNSDGLCKYTRKRYKNRRRFRKVYQKILFRILRF